MPLIFFYFLFVLPIMAKKSIKRKGKTMREYPNGVRKGRYGKITYSSRKRREKKENDFGLPEW